MAIWERWCREEQPNWLRGRYIYALDLGETRVLSLSGEQAVRKFHRQYAGLFHPQWGRVATEWDGIEIAPYVWPLRLDINVHWYYGWDCASGCIWRPRGAKLTLLGKHPPA